ncbi:MAG TPA: hypothetical protein VGA67_00455, partial [Candidatus Dojkabacteria bacterium]
CYTSPTINRVKSHTNLFPPGTLTDFSDTGLQNPLGILPETSRQHLIQFHRSKSSDTGLEIFNSNSPPTEKLYEEYWNLHSAEYREYIEKLRAANRLDEVDLSNKKGIIIVAAMNETRLDTTLTELADSYDGDFAEDFHVLVFHNFKNVALDDEIIEAMQRVRNLPLSMSIIDEMVPEFSNNGLAKKIASDLALSINTDLPMIFTDADVASYSTRILNDTLNELKREDVLGVSTTIDYHSEAKERWPVLGMIWDIDKEITTKYGLKSQFDVSTNLIGPFYSITPRTLILSGGIKPFAFEDMELSQSIKYLVKKPSMKASYRGFPFFSLEDNNQFVALEPDRELQFIINGQHPKTRWYNQISHSFHSGTKRFDWRSIKAEDTQDIHYLSEWNEENVAAAIEHYFFSYEVTGYMNIIKKNLEGWIQKANWLSKLLIHLLAHKKILLDDITIHRSEIDSGSLSLSGIEYIKQRYDSDDWFITGIEKISFIN